MIQRTIVRKPMRAAGLYSAIDASETGRSARRRRLTMNRKASAEILGILSANVKRLREARGLTQEELGDRCGYHRTYVSNIEHANLNVTLANLEALAAGLGCTVEDLLKRPDRS